MHLYDFPKELLVNSESRDLQQGQNVEMNDIGKGLDAKSEAHNCTRCVCMLVVLQ